MPQSRRDFLRSTAAASLATRTAGAMTRSQVPSAPGAPPRKVQTPVLDIGYEEHGPPGGTAIILLHGFPYDARSFDGVVAPLAAAGHRVLVPYLRGYGPTRFLDATVPRMAEQAAIGQDLIDFADALGIERFAVAGFDWGNRAACVAAILAPSRIIGQVAIGGRDQLHTGHLEGCIHVGHAHPTCADYSQLDLVVRRLVSARGDQVRPPTLRGRNDLRRSARSERPGCQRSDEGAAGLRVSRSAHGPGLQYSSAV